MGHGPSMRNNNKTTTPSLSRVNSNNYSQSTIIDTNPDPDSLSMPGIIENGNEGRRSRGPVSASPSLRTSRSFAKSTASLTKIFQRKRWRKKRKGSISASFNMHNNDITVEFINVNTATEEELMTLPGVNRGLARNIINHRELIVGFRKVEDLALVSGMGASKLTQIRPEICISRRIRLPGGMSLASSKTPSTESLPSGSDSHIPRPPSNLSRAFKVININQANMFELMTLDGINQALAARIIDYRERKGPFRSVDDLKRVGINKRLLAIMKTNLTTEDSAESDKSSNSNSNGSGTPTRPPRRVRPINGHNMCNSPAIGNSTDEIMNNRNKQIDEDLRIIYDFMSLKTMRPEPQYLFSYYHNNNPAYRVASWNLEEMTMEKISNPGVMEVVTRTILENRFSIVAVQEVCEKSALDRICKELNEPTLRLNRQWTGYRENWRFVLHPSSIRQRDNDHYLGVLYDSLRIDSVELPTGQEFGPVQNGSLWQYATFQIHAYATTWLLVNVLCVPLLEPSTSLGNGDNAAAVVQQADIAEVVKGLTDMNQGAMILGYFKTNSNKRGLSELTHLETVRVNQPTNAKLGNGNDAQPQPHGMWITRTLRQCLTDDHGLVTDGLTHLAIPNGWKMGGKISKFGPAWYTLYGTLEGSEEIYSEGSTELKDDNNDCEALR